MPEAIYMFRLRLLIGLAIVVLMSANNVWGGDIASLPEAMKRFIVRITNSEKTQGSGFILSDSTAGYLLVTNRHVVESRSTGVMLDSVLIWTNIIDSNNKVKSADSCRTLYLRHKGRKLFWQHPDKSVDIVLVSLGLLDSLPDTLTNPSGNQKIIGFRTDHIIPKVDFQVGRLNDGVQVQVVGFSEKLPQKYQYHVSRFGHLSFYPGEEINVLIDGKLESLDWLVLDVSNRGGDSGGPVFVTEPDSHNMYLLGFVQAVATKDELCYAIPSYYILETITTIISNFKK